MKQYHPPFKQPLFWWIPLAILLLMVPVSAYLDLPISAYFYEDHKFMDTAWTKIFFRYGPIPSLAVGLATLGLLIASIWVKRWRRWRKVCAYLLLTYAVGSGLITNVMLKDHWGRPRPKQVIEFGGSQEFRPFYSPHFSNGIPSKSFPSGHASAGFFFISLCVMGLRHQSWRPLKWGIWLSGTFGTLVGLTRIAQGGHFFTDVVIAGLVMWWTALIIDWLIYDRLSSTNQTAT